MAEIAFAAAAAHAPGLTGWPDRVSPESRRTVEESYARLGERIREANLDVLVMIANDHILNYNPADYPDFILGTAGEHVGPADWFRPWLNVDEYRIAGRPDVAETIHRRLKGDNGSVVENDALQFDDNVSVPVALTGFRDMGVALVPIIQNCTVPPVPDERRSYDMGRRLAAIVRDELPDGLRVGLLGSGGLSHEPGGPRYLEIDDDFDRWFLGLLDEGDHERILREATFERMEQAGAGGTAELLSWLVVMGAIGERPCDVMFYVAEREWRCGVGAVRWSLGE